MTTQPTVTDALSKKHRLTGYANTEELAALIAKVRAEMEARKDAAYLERNQVVAALAKCFPSGVARTAIEGWSEDWHGCVYIDLPTGQASWHFHDSQAYLFEGLPPYTGKWDGHDTPEKYRRLAALRPEKAQGEAVAWMPIDFAPRGPENKILLWCVNAYWVAHVKVGYVENGGQVYFCWNNDEQSGAEPEDFATHWMPLPEVPGKAAHPTPREAEKTQVISEVISNLGEWCENLTTQEDVDYISRELDKLTALVAHPSQRKAVELPPLPKKGRRFICTRCDSNVCKRGKENETHPPCDHCGYLGFAGDVLHSDETLQAYATAALAAAGVEVKP